MFFDKAEIKKCTFWQNRLLDIAVIWNSLVAKSGLAEIYAAGC